LRKDSLRVLLRRLSRVVRLRLRVEGWFSSMKVFLLLLMAEADDIKNMIIHEGKTNIREQP
jgi:hypothetical protein